MASRLDLQTKFEEILGSRNVYFQPPPSVTIGYPAIVYSRKSIDSVRANDGTYILRPSYEVVLIYKTPDSPFVESIMGLPYSRYERHYVSDNLHHDVFTIYN